LIKTRLLLPLLVFILSFPLGVVAQDQGPLTLLQCIEIALEQNPQVLAAAEYHRATLARVHQARALPQPAIGYDSDLQPSFFNFSDAEESYLGITFELPFPTKLSAQGNIAGKDSDIFLADTDVLKLDTVFRVKEAFYGLLLAQAGLSYAEDDLEHAEDFAEMTELKYAEGDVAEVEFLRARVSASGAMNRVRTATNDVRVARALLNYSLGRRDGAPLEIDGELRVPLIVSDLTELKELAYALRPESRAVELALEREEISKSLAYQSFVPDLEMGIARHRIEGVPTTWDVTFGVTVPLFFWQPKRGQVAEAVANISALALEREHVRNSISLEVEQAYRDAVTARDQIALFETDILRQAEEVHNMYLFSYQEGEIGGLELITARVTLLEARRTYADAQYGYAVAMAALQRAAGQGI
jgi:cobalt-zinc-cadmium efflux system outer membrane protein